MLLTFDTIKSITRGAIAFREESGCLYPRRCTEKQTEIWYTEEEVRGRRSKMSAGVRLDFYTDSATMRFAYPKGTSYSLLVDGIFLKKIENDEDCVANITLPRGQKRVTVVFHYDQFGGISELSLDDGATCEPICRDKKFLFLGDSITQGYHTEFEYINYPFLISEHFEVDFLNQAIGGGDFYAPTVDFDVPYEPDVVFIAFGTNDWSHFPTLQMLEQRCSDYLDAIKERYGDKKIFVLSPLWRADEHAGRPMGSFEMCCNVIKNQALLHGLTLIDGYKLVPHNPSFFIDKYLHPYTLGFSLYAQNLIKEIKDKI